MDYERFYTRLFRPVKKQIGRLDRMTSIAIIGFDCGGPLNLCTIGYGRRKFVTYISCELAVRDDQRFGEAGPFEVMMTCDDEHWARKMLTQVGRMSLESVFAHGHTVDISRIVERTCPLKGLVIEEFARVRLSRRSYGILRLHGVTGSELKFAMKHGSNTLLERLRKARVYPRTSIRRKASVA